MSEDVIRLEKHGFTVDVSPLGGAILRALWHGVPILAPTPTPGLASERLGAEACFPLVPFGNRIEGNAFRFEGRVYTLTPNTADPLVLHGDGWRRRWTVLRGDAGEVALQHRKAPDAASPFGYEALQIIRLADDALTLSLAVTNTAPQALPYGLGFHPYFPRTPATRLVAKAERYWSEQENHLPGSAGPFPPALDFTAGTVLPAHWLNNAVDGWDGKARIEWPDRGVALSLEAGAGFGCFVLYSPSAAAGFFCLEPMTHLPGAHRRPDAGGLRSLAPGETLAGEVVLRCARIAA